MSSDEMLAIRKRIRERREALGLSYQNLADLTGMSKSTLQRYETGDIGNLPLDKLKILASALDCSPAYIMGWDDLDERVHEVYPEWLPDMTIPEAIAKQKAATSADNVEWFAKIIEKIVLAYGSEAENKIYDEIPPEKIEIFNTLMKLLNASLSLPHDRLTELLNYTDYLASKENEHDSP